MAMTNIIEIINKIIPKKIIVIILIFDITSGKLFLCIFA